MIKWTPDINVTPVWVQASEFGKMHSFSSGQVTNTIKNWSDMGWYKREGRSVMINESWLQAYNDDIEAIWHHSIDIYYALTTGMGLNHTQLALFLAFKSDRPFTSWQSYIGTSLFRLHERNSLLSFNLSQLRLEFLKYGAELFKEMLDAGQRPVYNY